MILFKGCVPCHSAWESELYYIFWRKKLKRFTFYFKLIDDIFLHIYVYIYLSRWLQSMRDIQPEEQNFYAQSDHPRYLSIYQSHHPRYLSIYLSVPSSQVSIYLSIPSFQVSIYLSIPSSQARACTKGGGYTPPFQILGGVLPPPKPNPSQRPPWFSINSLAKQTAMKPIQNPLKFKHLRNIS